MVTDSSNIDMLPTRDNGLERGSGNLKDGLTELELLLREHQRSVGRERGDRNQQFAGRENIYRSGSAPPTVEGSLSAVGSLFAYPEFGENNGNGIGVGVGVGSSSASGNNGMLSEDEFRSHPAYLSYYYSHENINPRLPPPLLSKEDWRVAQRFQASGGSSHGNVWDWRKEKLVDGGDSPSLFSMQPGHFVEQGQNDLMELRNANARNMSRKMPAEWLGRGHDGLAGLSSTGIGARRKSFADILQDGLDRPASLSGHLSRPASRNTFSDMLDVASIADPGPPGFGAESMERLPGGVANLPSHGKTTSHSFVSVVGSSLSRSTTPEQHLVGRSPGSGLPPLGSKVSHIEKKNIVGSSAQNGHSSAVPELAELAATISGLNLSKTRHADENSHMRSHLQADLSNQLNIPLNMPNGHNHSMQQQFIEKSSAEKLSFSSNYIDLAREKGIAPNIITSKISSNGDVRIPKRTSSSADLYAKAHPSGFGSLEGSDVAHPGVNLSNTDLIGRLPGAYSVNQKLNSAIKNHSSAGSPLTGSGDRQSLNRAGNQGSDPLSPLVDPRYIQYLQRASQYGTPTVASPDSLLVGNYVGAMHGDLDGLQKAYIEAVLAQQKQQYELSLLGKGGGLNHGYYGNPSFGLGMPYAGNPLANSVLSSVGSGSIHQNDRTARFNSMMRSSPGSWHSDISNSVDRRYISSLLDEFKNNKTRSFELLDIVDHVVEFSTDQYGSRFIQQKLETATEEEKNKIFPKIIPHARALMTDVFGNYVIQRFFEHGTESQRAELATQLTGHVLPLSLQMYGCRVIQKAFEVVGLDQQTGMAAELDGSIMKCVRDQNGNHVIQKCIECVPQDRIQFIISAFYGQVVALSSHPYGCRVIQRVLEHCDDIKTQEIVMDEIMQSVCTLAQDQYGNYVIQHVLQHGKPHERSTIINKLAGQIVKMSQQKFASNVVEKCLTFGGPEERQILVAEMLGSTDENEPLQAMMKDQFGNYVVQKVLETCDDQNLELILSRIKVHLNALKKYTYGKHIVTRVEKLIATGEKRIGLLSGLSSLSS